MGSPEKDAGERQSRQGRRPLPPEVVLVMVIEILLQVVLDVLQVAFQVGTAGGGFVPVPALAPRFGTGGRKRGM